MRPFVRGILIGCVAAAVLVAAWIGVDLYRNRLGGDAVFGAPFTLVSMDGGPITEKALRGHPSTLFFGYTHCPDVCPTTLFELDGWLKKLGAEGQAIHSYFVTVDPERDTAAIMKDYVANVSNRITGITGDPAAVHAMLKAFGVYYRKVPGDGSDYSMDHTASVFLLDSAGRFRGTIAYGEDPDAALAKLKRLASE
jgi:protein SCO1